jgi:hypothetical protein
MTSLTSMHADTAGKGSQNVVGVENAFTMITVTDDVPTYWREKIVVSSL